MEALLLGFPVKVLSEGGLKSSDSRRWQNHPQLQVSLEYLAHILVPTLSHDEKLRARREETYGPLVP